MGNTFVIGDIHGSQRALNQLIDKINPNKESRFIFLGDYVDGWSESKQVIDFLIEFKSRYECVFLRGNHDEWCYQWLSKGESPELWLQHGGKETVASYQQITIAEKSRHIDFFKNLKPYHIHNENLFIHAGFTSLKGPQAERFESTCYWDRTLWELVLATDIHLTPDQLYYPKRLKLFKEIYIGHTPTSKVNSEIPLNKMNVWNIDTGAAFKGKLSAIEINTKIVYQTEPVYLLHPNEIGRNK